MKNFFLLLAVIMLNLFVSAQGKSGDKGKAKEKAPKTGKQVNKDDKNKQKEDKAKNDEHDRYVWDGVADKNSSCMKPSKNQPAKVRSSFQRDYPYAVNTRWTKCRGDWTATFGNGPFRSTAVYHANGDRRDTRTPIFQESLPRRVIDNIFKRNPDTRLDGIIKIEVPNTGKEIFRIKQAVEGKQEFQYYDSDGNIVSYDY